MPVKKMHVWGRVGVYTRFCWGNLTKRDHLEERGIDGRIILRCIFKKWDVRAWTESMWLRWRALVNAIMNIRVP